MCVCNVVLVPVYIKARLSFLPLQTGGAGAGPDLAWDTPGATLAQLGPWSPPETSSDATHHQQISDTARQIYQRFE